MFVAFIAYSNKSEDGVMVYMKVVSKQSLYHSQAFELKSVAASRESVPPFASGIPL